MRADGVLTSRDVARMLGVSITTVHSMANAGILPHVRVGEPDSPRPKKLFGRAEIEEWLRNGPRTNPPEAQAPGQVECLRPLAELARALLKGEVEVVLRLRRPENPRR